MNEVERQARRRPLSRHARRAIATSVAIGAAGLSSLAPSEPTGVGVVDLALRAAFAVLVVGAAMRARGRVLTVVAGGALVASALEPSPAAAVFAAVAGVLAYASDDFIGYRRAIRSGAGGALGPALLWLHGGSFHGDTLVIGVALLAPLIFSASRRASERELRRVAIGLAGLALIGGSAAAVTGLTVLRARHDVDRAVDAMEAGLDALRAADREVALDQFTIAAREFGSADRDLTRPWARAGRAVPVISQNARTIEELTSVGHELASVAAEAIAAADPDKATLSGGRLDLDAVAALEAPLEDTLESLTSAGQRAGAVGSPWLLPPLENAREDLLDRVEEAIPDARTALAASRVAPDLFGASGPRRYFVAFVTPAEARASGGIVGNFAELTAEDGRLAMAAFGRNSDLNRGGDPEGKRLVGPPDYVARYGDFNIPNYWQDVTFSPDFPSVAQVIEGLYPQSGGREVDGVISIDPFGLAALLELTGPVEVAGLDEPLTAGNAPRLLLRDQYVRFTEIAERVDFLETTAAAVFDRLTTTSLPGPGEIADALGPAVRQGRIKVHSVEDAEEEFLTDIGLAGELQPVRGQFLGVYTQTASQSKVDAFLRREIDYDAVVDPATGRTEALVTVTLHNDAPSSGLPQYVIGGGYKPPGVNYMNVAVYSPLQLVGAELDGAPFEMEEETELERWVVSGYVDVPPESSITLRVRLAGTVALRVEEGRTRVRLDVARQALVEPDQLTVRIRLAPGWEDRATGKSDVSRSLELTQNAVFDMAVVSGANS